LLAGLLMVAAARLFDLERLRYVARTSVYDSVLLWMTAVSAVALDIEYAVLIGTALSMAWYVTRASKLEDSELIVTPERVVRPRVDSDPVNEGVLIYDLEGELFFAAAPFLENFLEQVAEEAEKRNIRYVVLRMKRARNPDAVTLEILDSFLRKARSRKLTVLLAGVRAPLFDAFTQAGIAQSHSSELVFIEEEKNFSSTLKAIRRAYELAAIEAKDAGKSAEWETLRSMELAYYLV